MQLVKRGLILDFIGSFLQEQTLHLFQLFKDYVAWLSYFITTIYVKSVMCITLY